jgi:hypothetical protein
MTNVTFCTIFSGLLKQIMGHSHQLHMEVNLMPPPAAAPDKHSGHTRRIAWHPAFFAALRLALEDYSHILDFDPEHQLNGAPLSIDALVTLKAPRNPVKTGIAALFRRKNIIEYKSPDDYLSIRDFHKALGYAGIYGDKEKLSMARLSITLVSSRYPVSLLRYLPEFLRRDVEEREPGIYVADGATLPIQVIEIRRLRGDNNEWLRDLGRRLDAERLEAVERRTRRRRDDTRIGAYLEAVFGANAEMLIKLHKEGKMRMPKDFPAIAEEMGWAAMWEAKGRAELEKAQEEIRRLREGNLQLEEGNRQLEEENRRLREGGKQGRRT